ncbi:MAG TPA: DUF4279 domain-containing protein [Herpetosiphonaceae bacterium]
MAKYRLDYTHGGTSVVSFRIAGEHLDPAAITKDLGVEPTKSWKNGDRRGETNSRYSFGYWALSPQCAPTEPLETQLALLLTQLEGLPPILADHITTFESGITVGLTSADTHLGICLDPELIKRMGRLSVWLDLDLYFVGGDG